MVKPTRLTLAKLFVIAVMLVLAFLAGYGLRQNSNSNNATPTSTNPAKTDPPTISNNATDPKYGNSLQECIDNIPDFDARPEIIEEAKAECYRYYR